MRRKKTSKGNGEATENTAGIGLVVADTESTEFAARTSNRTSKYEFLSKALNELEVGKSLLLTPPKDCEFDQFKGRITGAMNTIGVLPPDGAKFRRRKTVDGDLAISCVAE